MRKILAYFKKEAMLTVSLLAALVSLVITPPSAALLSSIDWKTLATLFMLLSVLDGFKHENLFRPVIRLASKVPNQVGLSFFLVFAVFFSSMFVTNDVSLIIFVPLTMILFRAGNKEQYIVPVLVLENIAAVRGSLLTPFGSPQNLFLFGKSGMSAGSFMLMMLPLWLGSMVLLSLFILFLHRKNLRETIILTGESTEGEWKKENRAKRAVYLFLFAVIVTTIVTRTTLWPYVTLFVAAMLLIFDRSVFRRVDYVLLLTFLCFFVFSSSIAAHPAISAFLHKSVAGNEYWWSLALSQVISNVPASIVLWPFCTNLRALIYGLDTAGLLTVIGSLASVINMRIYLREYPGNGKKFMLAFEKICLIFFLIVVVPQWLICR
ncbi:MAG: SLC13 family permease [Clostridia bacterium]|nr:SLC13 family permease [Clostridia bacterium]